jgi:hypothetical protein
MKKIFFILVFIFGAAKAPAQNNCATIKSIEGVQIFINAEPGNKYKYLGTTKINITLTGAPGELIQAIIKKTKKNYPGANALIFKSLELDEAEAIILE